MTKLEPAVIDFKAKEIICISNMLVKASMSKELIDDDDIREDARVYIDNIGYINNLLEKYTPEYIIGKCLLAGYAADIERLFKEARILNVG